MATHGVHATSSVDLLVIGGGSGGLAGAKRAARLGARVALVEAAQIGGTCVLRGCIPKKLMVYASQLGQARQLAAAYGWPVAKGAHDWAALRQTRDGVVARLVAGHRRQLLDAGVDVICGRARFVDRHTVAVGEARITAKYVLIATGGKPVRPTVAGVEHCCDSDDFFRLEAMPRSVALCGGGYIAVEFACLLRHLGCRVHMLVRSQLLRGFDHALGAHVADRMRAEGIRIHEGAVLHAVRNLGDGALHLEARRGDTPCHLEAQACVLFAIGRRPQTLELDLPSAGVDTTADGAIITDAAHKTTAGHIFAVGDVIDRVNLTPVAIAAARSVCDGLFGGGAPPFSYSQIPTAVFSEPPVGSVGLTQAQAQARFKTALRVFESRFVPLSQSVLPQGARHAALIRVLVDANTDRIVGLHMAGDDAPEIIQGFAAAMVAGITKTQLDATVAIHPTLAEEFVLLA